MFEIFFFINPIGIYCYDTEKKIQKTATELGIDVSYHFIPIVNSATIQDDIMRRRKECQCINSISWYTMAVHHALADYHALKIAYGNKKARIFLLNLQQALDQDETVFSSDLSQKILTQMHINLGTIQKLRKSKYVFDSIAQDQKLIEQWQVQTTPTTIIFNEDNDNTNGFMLEGTVSQNDLLDLFVPNRSKKVEQDTTPLFSNNYLRLI